MCVCVVIVIFVSGYFLLLSLSLSLSVIKYGCIFLNFIVHMCTSTYLLQSLSVIVYIRENEGGREGVGSVYYHVPFSHSLFSSTALSYSLIRILAFVAMLINLASM